MTKPENLNIFDYTLIRSRRHTIAIHIKKGGVEVRAPFNTPLSVIKQFVISKESWIVNNLAQSIEQLQMKNEFALTYGDILTMRGTLYPLTARAGSTPGFDGKEFFLPPNLAPEEIKFYVTQLYRHIAKNHFTKRTEHFAKTMHVKPNSIKISNAKTSWGSCSAKSNINYSWRLIMADDQVIDYVVVHELAHLIELNHSPYFWEIVRCLLPDYRERQKQLQELQQKLTTEDWD